MHSSLASAKGLQPYSFHGTLATPFLLYYDFNWRLIYKSIYSNFPIVSTAWKKGNEIAEFVGI
jgi:hypothetical protein